MSFVRLAFRYMHWQWYASCQNSMVVYILSRPCQLPDSTLVIYTVRSMSIVRLNISYIHCILSDPCQLSDWSLVIYTVRSMSIVRLVISYIYCQIHVNCQTGQYLYGQIHAILSDWSLTIYTVRNMSIVRLGLAGSTMASVRLVIS